MINYRKIFREEVFCFPSSWDIHHIDFNRENNEKENLVALPKKFHAHFHKISNNFTRLQKELNPKNINFVYDFDLNEYCKAKNLMFLLYRLQHVEINHIDEESFNNRLQELSWEWL